MKLDGDRTVEPALAGGREEIDRPVDWWCPRKIPLTLMISTNSEALGVLEQVWGGV